MKTKLMILVYLLFSLRLYTQETEEMDHIAVSLATESSLQPSYLVPLTGEQTNFTHAYLKQLEDILAFDLNHNGKMTLVKPKLELNQLVPASFEQLGSAFGWKKQNIFYVVGGKIQGSQLFTLILNVNDQILRSIDPISLSGNLYEDRRQMHRLADAIHQALFYEEGIASSRILYTVKSSGSQGKWASEVWESDYDGGNAHPITMQNQYCVTPAYIPPKAGYNPGGFIYVSYQIGQPKIYMASLRDGIGQRLISLRGNQLMPAISKQRNRIAFISDITGNPDLFIQDFSLEKGALGKPQQVFAARQATQGSPSFSPDGKRLAFVSDKDGSPKIYILNIPSPGTSLNNIKVTLISKRNRENSAPCWSPDGTKIAYCSRTKDERQIWIYDFSVNQEKQITFGKGNKENPSWAPNSLHLVFNSSDANASELYIVNLNQLEALKITSGKGEKRFPCWEPKGK